MFDASFLLDLDVCFHGWLHIPFQLYHPDGLMHLFDCILCRTVTGRKEDIQLTLSDRQDVWARCKNASRYTVQG